jgi:hypothetical protein
MMKSAEDRLSGELAEPMGRRILVQGRMRSEPVIAGVDRKNLAQMGLAEGDDVIEAFPRIEPISLSARPFCQGDLGVIG